MFFFFQNVLGDIHFQLLPENFYIEIKNSSNKNFIYIFKTFLSVNTILLKSGDHIRCTWRTPVIRRFSSRKCDIMKEPEERSARRRNKKTWYEAKFVSFSSPWSIRWDIRLVFTLQMEFSGERKFAGLRSIVNSCHPPFVSFKTHPRLD